LKLFSKKKQKSFEILKSGDDEEKWQGMSPEVRFEPRVEQKSQRVEMRIYIF
jgi:hypothetical protein